MKCPKCGCNNEESAIFCEVCDWKLNQPYVKEKGRFPTIFIALFALVMGIIALVSLFVEYAYLAIGAGAVGLMIGSYSMNVSRIRPRREKMPIFAIAALALCISAFGFLMGINIL